MPTTKTGGIVSITQHCDVSEPESELRTMNSSDSPRETEFSGKVFRASPRHPHPSDRLRASRR